MKNSFEAIGEGREAADDAEWVGLGREQQDTNSKKVRVTRVKSYPNHVRACSRMLGDVKIFRFLLATRL